MRKRILQNTSKLKHAGNTFQRIYVKKDIHPAVRKELNRMHLAEREEERKPENQGREVKYDPATRCLTVDGMVVDRFKPTFFQMQG